MKFEKSIFLGACSIAASLFCFDAGAVIYIDNFLTQAGKDRINRMTSQELRKTIAEVTNISLDEVHVNPVDLISLEKKIDEIGGLYIAGLESVYGLDISNELNVFFQKQRNFKIQDHGATLDGLNNQCPILSLGLDDDTSRGLQAIPHKGTTLGRYIDEQKGLTTDAVEEWNLLADAIGSTIIIYSFTDYFKNFESVNMYKGTGEKSFDKIKRVALQPGHFVELKLK